MIHWKELHTFLFFFVIDFSEFCGPEGNLDLVHFFHLNAKKIKGIVIKGYLSFPKVLFCNQTATVLYIVH